MATKTVIYAQGTGTIYTSAASETPLTATWVSTMVSLKNSLKITQEEGEIKESFIDQADAPIARVKYSGKMTIEWTLPNTAKAMWEKLFKTVTTASPATGDFTGMDATGVQLQPKTVNDMLRVDMKENGQKFVFPYVDWTTVFAKEDDDNPTCFKIKVTLMASDDAAQPDFYVLNPTA